MLTKPTQEMLQLISDFLTNENEIIEAKEKELLLHHYEQLKKEMVKRRKEVFQNAMTLKELFWKVKFEQVFEILVDEFEYDEEEYYELKKIYQNVLKAEIKEKEFALKVDEDGEVTGISFEDSDDLSIMLLPMETIANAFVEEESLQEVGKDFFAASLINEIMWLSDDEEKEEIEAELKQTKGVTLAELLQKEEEKPSNVIALSSLFMQKGSIKEDMEALIGSDRNHYSNKSIRTLLHEIDEETIKESFEEVLHYVEHPLLEKNWKTIFKYAYNALKGMPIKEGAHEVCFSYEYTFLTQFKNDSEKGIKCVIFGDQVAEYLDCPTNAIIGKNFFPDEEKPAYAILSYIGDTFAVYPDRFKDDYAVRNYKKENEERAKKRDELLQAYLEDQEIVYNLSNEDFENLYFVFELMKRRDFI